MEGPRLLTDKCYYEVAKTIITVDFQASVHYLMSVKRDPGRLNEGKLEFLGGRLEPGESPHEGLFRELSEEEKSGRLLEIARKGIEQYAVFERQGSKHFLFPLKINEAHLCDLQHCPVESFGFKLIPQTLLTPDDEAYTRKTNRIIAFLTAQQLSGQ